MRAEEAQLVLAEAADEPHATVLGVVQDVFQQGEVDRAVLLGLEDGDLALERLDGGHGLEDDLDPVGGAAVGVAHVGVGDVGSERGRHAWAVFCGWLWILAYLRWCSRREGALCPQRFFFVCVVCVVNSNCVLNLDLRDVQRNKSVKRRLFVIDVRDEGCGSRDRT